MHERLLIIGAKGQGKVVADIALRTGSYKDIAFLEDNVVEDFAAIYLGLNVSGCAVVRKGV